MPPEPIPFIDLAALARNINRTTGKFTAATIDYWLEWLETKTPLTINTPEEILAWISDMEYEVGHVLDSEIPSHWLPSEEPTDEP